MECQCSTEINLEKLPVHQEANNSGQGNLTQNSKQSDESNVSVINTKRTEVVDHHTKPGSQDSLKNVYACHGITVTNTDPHAVSKTEHKSSFVS